MTVIGKQIKQYEIIKKIGQGGMADVFKAYDSRLERFVAIKFLTRMLLQDPNSRKRFLREARAASSLNHPNITIIYEIDQFENMDYIVMEFIDGVTLGSEIDKSPLEPIRVIEIIRQCASALGRAHATNIIHRDIKPDNIMITKDANIKIMDFGLAKMDHSTRITPMGYVLGTPAYISPEQAQRTEVDSRCDIFSLGVVMYEALTGKLPFTGDTEISVMYNVVHEQPKPITSHNVEIPKELVAVVNTCMAKKIKNRYQTCEDLDSDLEHIAEKLKHGVSNIPKSPALKTQQRRLMLKKLAMPSAVGLLVLTLAAIFHFVIMPFVYPEKPRLAVLPVQDSTEQKQLMNHRWSLAFALTKTLEQSDQLDVIPYGRIQDIFMSLNRIDEPVLGTEAVMEVAKNLEAKYIVWGLVQNTEDGIILTGRIIEFPAWIWDNETTVHADDVNDLYKNIDDLTIYLRRKLEPKFSETDNSTKTLTQLTTSSPGALRYFVEAQRYISQVDIGPADVALQNAVELDSMFALANAFYAVTRRFNGAPMKQAMKYIARAERHSHDLSERENKLVRLIGLRLKVECDEGLALATEMESLFPNDEFVLKTVGNVYWGCQKLQDAARVFKKIIEKNPWHLYSLEALGDILTSRGEWDSAEEYLEQVIKIAPLIANAHHCLGWHYFCRGSYWEAIEAFNKANRLKHGYASLELGETYELLGFLDKAEHYFNQCLINPQNVKIDVFAIRRFGELQIRRGQLQDAMEFYNNQLQNRPNELSILANLGVIMLKQNDTAGCENILQTIAQIDTSQTWFHYLRGHRHLYSDQPEYAIPDLQTALNILKSEDPTLACHIRCRLAEAHLKLGRIHVALEHYQELNKSRPQRPNVLQGLAQCYAMKGQSKKAIQFFNEVLDIWSNSTEIDREKLRIEKEIEKLVSS